MHKINKIEIILKTIFRIQILIKASVIRWLKIHFFEKLRIKQLNHLEIKKKNLYITVRVTMMRKMISQVNRIRNKDKIMINNNNKIMIFLKN